MMRKRILVGILTMSLCFFWVSFASADELGYFVQGGIAPDYDWWHGCSPTSAGMMMGYYDINGYGSLTYDNLVPGGVAETTTFPPGTYLANDAIASSGHRDDFYSGGYGASGDDVDPPWHSFDSLADFMGTSQDAYGNSNGWTKFYYLTSGNPLSASYAASRSWADEDGMLGMWEYFDYAGYGSGNPANTDFYTQLTDNQGATYGFTFDDYVAEIDAGRVVMLHVEGHSMFGYGYDEAGALVYLHDTWTEDTHSMTWGGAYSGRDMWGVTSFTPTGGAPVPEPCTLFLVGCGLLGLACFRKRFKREQI